MSTSETKLKEAVETLKNLKAATAKEEATIQAMHATLNQIRANIKKSELLCKTIKGRNTVPMDDAKSTTGSIRSGSKSIHSQVSFRQGSNRADPLRNNFIADAKDTLSPHGNADGHLQSHSNRSGTVRSSRPGGAFSAVPPATAVRQDAELEGLSEEHEVLQRCRRALLERVETGKASFEGAKIALDNSSGRTKLLEKRIQYFSDGKEYITSITAASRGAGSVTSGGGFHRAESKPSSSISSSVKATSSLGKRTGSIASGVGGGGSQQGSISAEDEDAMEADFVVFDRLRSLLLDNKRIELALQEGVHVISQDSSMAAIAACRDQLERQESDLQTELEEAKKRHSEVRERIRVLTDTDKVFRMREFITYMQTTLLRFQRNERLSSLEEGYNTIELELLQKKLRKREKREMSEHNDVSM